MQIFIIRMYMWVKLSIKISITVTCTISHQQHKILSSIADKKMYKCQFVYYNVNETV